MNIMTATPAPTQPRFKINEPVKVMASNGQILNEYVIIVGILEPINGEYYYSLDTGSPGGWPESGLLPLVTLSPSKANDIGKLAAIVLTDAGNGEFITSLYGDFLRYDHRRRRWLLWTTHRWAPDVDGVIMRLALASARRRLKLAAELNNDDRRAKTAKWAIASENNQKLKSAVDLAKNYHPITNAGDRFDSDPWLLGCSNGVIDLRSLELRPGRQCDNQTMTTNVEYDPQATAPRWELFLREVFNKDEELIEFIQRSIGYSLTGDIREHVLFLCHGLGSNGKSTLLNAIRAVLGDYAANTPFSTFELGKGTQTNDLAALEKMRFVTASETHESRRLNEARVKAITGGDPVSARFLFSEWFDYFPGYKVWLAMNHKPVITGTDEGIWRRIRLIPFSVSFKGREDKTLGDVLKAEAPGILAWAVRGCLGWITGGLTEPKAVLAATEEYRKESDLLSQFLADCTTELVGARIKGDNFYQAYLAWCVQNNEHSVTGTTFGRRMKERGIDSVRLSGNIWYLDIATTNP